MRKLGIPVAMAIAATSALLLSPATNLAPATTPAATRPAVDERDVMAVAESYGSGGGYEWKGGSGVPEDVVHEGAVILRKQPAGTYCSGYTFAVGFRVATARGLLKGKSAAQVKQMQKAWYAVTDPANPDVAEKGLVAAIVLAGIGKEIPLAQARPGDFVQIWRQNKSGHSVIFLSTQTKAGKTSLTYLSTQKSTQGIGIRTETIGENDVDPKRIYVARLNDKP